MLSTNQQLSMPVKSPYPASEQFAQIAGLGPDIRFIVMQEIMPAFP